MIEALGLPFMQRAVLAGLLVGLVTSLLGVFVVVRRSAFFGDAIAHASLAGVALGVVAGLPPLGVATAVGVGIGLALPRLERRSRLSLDTLLGVVLPLFMGLGIVILSLTPGYQPELLSYLFGSILAVGPGRLAAVALIAVGAGGLVLAIRGALTFAAFDPEGAHVAGIDVPRVLTLYHALLALVVVAGISVVGIVLVNGLLVIPAATAKLLARSLGHMLVLSPILGALCVLLGLAGACWLDVPPGPAIVVVAGLLFATVWAGRAWLGSPARRGAVS